MFRGGSPASGIAAITGGTANFDAGTVSSPSITLGGDAAGWFRNSASQWTWEVGGVPNFNLVSLNVRIHSNGKYVWGSTDANSSVDTGIGRNAAGVVEINNGTLGSFAGFKAAQITASAGTATPAGGSAAAAVLLGTTAGLGVYFGSGAPTVSAAQGSLYVRTDGSSTSTRLYVNTNGSTTWTNVTTAA